MNPWNELLQNWEEPVLPSDEQLAAAIATNDLRSEPLKKFWRCWTQDILSTICHFKVRNTAGDNRAASTVAPVQNDAPENQQLPMWGMAQTYSRCLDKVIREKEAARG